jgi:ornithine carbamoyltransferase
MRHLRTTLDIVDDSAIDALLQRAQELKRHRAQRRIAPTLAGRVIGVLFERPSTRTRVSFQAGSALLGAHCIVLEGRDIWLKQPGSGDEGEVLRDTARVIGGAVDLLVMRPARGHAPIEELARHAGVPVINGLSDRDHPCQVLTDLFTIYERRERPYDTALAFVGDSVAMANGYLALAALTGISVRLAMPEGAQADVELRRRAEGRGAKVLVTHDPVEAIAGADAIATSAWTGAVAKGFCIDDALLARAADDAIVLHTLPAHRGQEITDDVLEGPRSVAFQQANNRLPVQQAIMELLLGH